MRSNYIYLRGNLGVDPTLKTSAGKMTVASGTLATNSQHGEGESSIRYTQWHDVVAFDDKAHELLMYKKGAFVEIEGHFSYRLSKEGKPTKTVSVVVDRIAAISAKTATSPQSTDAPST